MKRYQNFLLLQALVIAAPVLAQDAEKNKKDSAKTLDEVVVVGAGTFEASDKAKGASLTPMDAVTVAGSGGDIANALRSLPGAQQLGEREGLFVRGGTGEETRQFVDGVQLRNPNYSQAPGFPPPARINPFLFKGILFSSGAYSALYGQAMSSALILESVDLPDESAASLSIFPMQVAAGFQKVDKKRTGSYGVNARYGNHKFYNELVNAKPDFFQAPGYISADANFRVKTSKTGMLKFYTNYGKDHTGIRYPMADSSNILSGYEVKGNNIYSNLSYRENLGGNWKIDAALAHNYNKQEFSVAKNNYQTRGDFGQARFVATRSFRRRQAIRFGAEYFYTKDRYVNKDTVNSITDNLVAAFAEADVYIARNLAARVGARAERSSLMNKTELAPRVSLGYRFNDGGQVNIAYGKFYQQPSAMYLLRDRNIAFSNADHYIINYQKKAGNRLLRVEGYYKKYNNLITTKPGISNDGDGYAKGVELFFRDKKTFKNFDCWITYTYLDTKRKFLDYPYRLQPDFATPHTATIAIKRFFQAINFNANLSYTFATGRPYYNFQADESGKPYIYDFGTTNNYSGLNLSFAYLFSMFKNWKNKDFSGIGMGVNNVFGRKQVFGYSYNPDGTNKVPIMLPAARTFYFGIFMSFGTDRRDDFINENL